jgi:YegS/Rv2252/BmrU family lipid kinase
MPIPRGPGPARAALRTMVIVNPTSGAGASGRRWKRTARALGRALGTFEQAFTTGPLHATRLAQQALRDGCEMVVAVGGDGTLNEVVCGFFDAGRAVAPQAMLGVVALGTGSDFARTLGRPDLEEACARLAGRGSRPIDVGHARFRAHDGTMAERVFVNVASFGCSGRVARMMSPRLKHASGSLAFTLATARALMTFRDQRVAMSLDDGPALEYSITNCAFCNARYFGAGVQVAPQALIDDGSFDVTLWSGFGLLDFVRKRRSLYSGAHIQEPGTRLLHARRATATSADEVLLELDGESVGRLPVELELLPRALRLKV